VKLSELPEQAEGARVFYLIMVFKLPLSVHREDFAFGDNQSDFQSISQALGTFGESFLLFDHFFLQGYFVAIIWSCFINDCQRHALFALNALNIWPDLVLIFSI